MPLPPGCGCRRTLRSGQQQRQLQHDPPYLDSGRRGEPNGVGGNEDYEESYNTSFYGPRWNDGNCLNSRTAICEWPQEQNADSVERRARRFVGASSFVGREATALSCQEHVFLGVRPQPLS
ncbi:MAG: hypothetical protein ACJAYU_004731 [Bradymonadia bacterium]|jgi:hypothetical protein